MNILSIDGGGIRGIIPAIVLAEIEEKTKQPIAESFDLIAGTSTGALIALILNVKDANGKPKYSANEVVELYEKRGAEIFDMNLLRKIRSGLGLFEEAYSNAGLKKIVETYFGKNTLKDTITEVLVPTYETEQRTPWFFKSVNAKNPEYENRNYLLSDVALGATAAPTYFEAHKVPYKENNYLSLIDGGIYANNPALCAYIDAKEKWGKADHEINIVSLGTGQVTKKLLHNEIINWGKISWVEPLISCAFDGVSDTVDYHLSKILPKTQYFRLQKQLNENAGEMDNTSEKNMRILKLEALEIIAQNSDKIESIVSLIRAPK
jgi:patatin-like phospholipase/acyl hydrolase